MVEEQQEARKRHLIKSYIKTVLKKFNEDPKTFETNASNRSLWRSLYHGGIELFEEKKRDEKIRRKIRHQIATLPPLQQGAHNYPNCGKVCRSRIGQHSHLMSHQRRDE